MGVWVRWALSAALLATAVWADTAEAQLILKRHGDQAFDAAFSPDGTRIVSSGRDQYVRIWNAETGDHIRQMHEHSSFIHSVAYSPDSARIACGVAGHGSRIVIWDAETGERLNTLETPHGEYVLYSQDGSLLISTGTGGTEIRGANTLNVIRTLSGAIYHADISSDNSNIVTGGHDGAIRFWDVDTGENFRTIHNAHDEIIRSIEYSPDDSRVVTGSGDGTVRIWSVTGALLGTLEGHLGSVDTVAYSIDGSEIASGSRDHTVRIWDAVTGEHLRTFFGHTSELNSVAYSPDGLRIVSASADDTVQVWGATPGPQPFTLDGREESVYTVSWSPDGSKLVTNTIQI